jgi:RecA/RadA recombinase
MYAERDINGLIQPSKGLLNMISVYMDGNNKTKQITDWTIWHKDESKELMLTCYFPSGKKFTRPMQYCKIEPMQYFGGDLLICRKGSMITSIDKAEIYGKKFAVVRYPDSNKTYVYQVDEVEIIQASNFKNEAVFNYFIEVAKARCERGNNDAIAENVLRQLEKLLPYPATALHAYCQGSNQPRKRPKHFIYPFGINESQLKAVESAFSSQISVIEGPPGTGKTQTILNIIANILLQDKTVAILSNNNAAVENVYDKLAQAKLDYLVAKLGSSQNRTAFFGSPIEAPPQQLAKTQTLAAIGKSVKALKSHLKALNQTALLNAQIDELKIELGYLLRWRQENAELTLQPLEKYRFSSQKITELMAFLHHLAQRRITLRDRLRLLLDFKIFRTGFINDWQKRKALFYALQLVYYHRQLAEKNALLAQYQQTLDSNNFDTLLKQLTENSMHYLKAHLAESIDHKLSFTVQSYRRQFDAFLKRFPIIGSSSHSIVNSIGNGAMLDYLIIDEASQQDIIPGILGLGCARNVIIVGDRQQLPHVPTVMSITPPGEVYDCDKYSLLDSVIQRFGDAIPVTLLKEHYRCHPKIIQFCNKQFYHDQLIPMTVDRGEKALTMITTALGNHTRSFANLRELDSINWALWQQLDENKTGFIAPYNNQVDLSCQHLPAGVTKATAHKFQGRECDNIILSTVLDNKSSSQKARAFVDDPHLINVAVSRAKNKFILVTGKDVFQRHNQSVAALIRYINYYADGSDIIDSPVISAFDLLYQDYDQSLEALNGRLRARDSAYKSERIVAQLLREILQQPPHPGLTFHQQIRLIQLVSGRHNDFSERENDYIHNGASCDFVLYFKTGKNPVGVIEVDGDRHREPQRIENDQLKNAILAKAGLPLLRLKTIECEIEEKIKAFVVGVLGEEGIR